MNTFGSYECQCRSGFVLHDNKHDCKEGKTRAESEENGEGDQSMSGTSHCPAQRPLHRQLHPEEWKASTSHLVRGPLSLTVVARTSAQVLSPYPHLEKSPQMLKVPFWALRTRIQAFLFVTASSGTEQKGELLSAHTDSEARLPGLNLSPGRVPLSDCLLSLCLDCSHVK